MTRARRVLGQTRGLPPLVLLSGLLSGLLLFGATGCVLHTPRTDRVARQLEAAMPGVHFQALEGVKLGRISLGLAGRLTAFAADQDEDPDVETASRMLRELRRVEVATYGLEGEEPSTWPRELEDAFRHEGWSTLARIHEPDGTLAWVLYQGQFDRMHSALVIHLEHEELNVVRLEGRLDRVIYVAMDMVRDGESKDGESTDGESKDGEFKDVVDT